MTMLTPIDVTALPASGKSLSGSNAKGDDVHTSFSEVFTQTRLKQGGLSEKTERAETNVPAIDEDLSLDLQASEEVDLAEELDLALSVTEPEVMDARTDGLNVLVDAQVNRLALRHTETSAQGREAGILSSVDRKATGIQPSVDVRSETAQPEKPISSQSQNRKDVLHPNVTESAGQVIKQAGAQRPSAITQAAQVSTTPVTSTLDSKSVERSTVALMNQEQVALNLPSSPRVTSKPAGGRVDIKTFDTDAFMRHVDQSIKVAAEMNVADKLPGLLDKGLPPLNPAAGETGLRMDAANIANVHVSSSTPLSGAAASHLSPTPSYTVATPIEHEGWARAMSQQVISFIKRSDQGEHIAELRLDPPHLGPIRVSISVADGIAHAVFAATNQFVRQTLEQALPELSRSMAEAGIDLGQADVNSGQAQGFTSQQQGSKQAAPPSTGSAVAQSDAPNEEANPLTPRTSHDGLVNTFA